MIKDQADQDDEEEGSTEQSGFKVAAPEELAKRKYAFWKSFFWTNYFIVLDCSRIYFFEFNFFFVNIERI